MKQKKIQLKKRIAKMKNYQIGLILAFVQSVASYFYSCFFFNFDVDNVSAKQNKLLVDVLFFGIMFLAYWGLVWIVRNGKKYKPYIRFALVYFALLMTILILVWPGVWRNDDMGTAMMAKGYALDGWQHVLTSVFYMISYKLLPFYSGVIIIQGAIIAIISSYLYYSVLANTSLKNRLVRVILFIPFVLPPVLDNSLYPLRPILYSYLCVLLIFVMIKFIRLKKLSTLNLMFLVGLFVVCAGWRSEGIYLIVVAFIYFIYLAKKRLIMPFMLFVSLIGSFGGVLLVRQFENSQLNQYSQMRYSLSSTVEIAAPLIRKAHEDNRVEDLEKIDKVLNVDLVVGTNLSGEKVFWDDSGVRLFDAEEYGDYMKTLAKLILAYPGEVVSERLMEFEVTSALVDDEKNVIWDTTANYDGSSKERIQTFISSGGGIMNPISTRLRKAVIRILEGRDIYNYNNTIFTYPLFWNLLVPLFGIFAFVVWQFIRRRIAVALIVASILVKTVIVFLTAPGPYHMYYFAEYLLGYILVAYMVVSLVQRCFVVRRKAKTIK
ncbi:hypothetical protein J5491_01490 [Candidatus Saccharibacteria bacterium]|nr:hypothetical protein [Candidatus Saccharibacteria bacterium]